MAELIAHVKETLLPRRDASQRFGLGTSAMYERMNPNSPRYDPTFPKPVVLSGTPDKATCVRWVESEVDAWIAAQIEKSRKVDSKVDRQGGVNKTSSAA